MPRLTDHGCTWLFGEEFNLTASDKSLDAVLRRHIPSEIGLLDEREVQRSDGSRGIVDLMLSRLVPSPRPEHKEHLIVELKRPTVLIGPKELAQVESYAFAIARDERFHGVKARWVFWALAKDMDEIVQRKANQKDKPAGLVYEGGNVDLQIWVKTWGQVIDECRARLRFFEERLQYAADDVSAMDHLRQMHARYLPPELLKQTGRIVHVTSGDDLV